jgi:PAS domain S-box-containing protein
MTPSRDQADSALSPEARERQQAIRRGRNARSASGPQKLEVDPLAGHAFAALAENVRDYAIFLMNPEGIIRYWGEGARLMKWWSREEATGSHLRLLYPEGGSEDGTAEAHLRESAEIGEYIGEGQRMRPDGSTFWAGVTLTALRDTDGTLLGFAKVTRDLTVRRAAEAALALAWSAQSARDRAVAEAAEAHEARDNAEKRAEFALEQVRSARAYATEVLERDLVSLQSEHASMLAEMALLNGEIQRLSHPLEVKPGSGRR